MINVCSRSTLGNFPIYETQQALVLNTKIFTFYLVINLFSLSIVFAQPQGAHVEKGAATFTSPNASTLDITASNNTIINFSSFDIAKNETVDIILPSNTASVLIRDTSSTESQILGSLFSNGDLILTNPNGIYFGRSANGHVNNFIASSLAISDNDFINGNYVFEHRKNAPYGQVSNEGTIKAKNLVLQGSSANNSGDIQATVGYGALSKLGGIRIESGNVTIGSNTPRREPLSLPSPIKSALSTMVKKCYTLFFDF